MPQDRAIANGSIGLEAIEGHLTYNWSYRQLEKGEQKHLLNAIKFDLDALEFELGNDAMVLLWSRTARRLAVDVDWTKGKLVGNWKKIFNPNKKHLQAVSGRKDVKNHFTISLFGGHVTIVKANSIKDAKEYALKEFGLQAEPVVRPASDSDIAWVQAMHGAIHNIMTEKKA